MTISIDDLRNEEVNEVIDPNLMRSTKTFDGNFTEVSPEAIPTKNVVDTSTTIFDETLSLLDEKIKKDREEAMEYIAEIKLNEELEREISDEDMESDVETEETNDISDNEILETNTVVLQKSPTQVTFNELSFIDDMDDELEDEVNDDDISDEQMEILKSSIREKLKPVTEKMDISSFSIAKKPIAFSKTLQHNESTRRVTDWVLMSSKKPFSMIEFGGTEIESLNLQSSGRNRLNSLKDVYQKIYDHISDPNKPTTLEQWLKTTSFLDNDHLYFGIYKSNFEGANYIPYNCTNNKCNHVFLSDNTPIMDMVKFKDDKAKAEFTKIASGDTSNTSGLYVTEVIPVSNNYAISFREPSIYNVVIENASLDSTFTDKYSNLLSILIYIDTIYYIDTASRSLIPISIKEYPNDLNKTTKAKVIQYSKILQTLNSDQYNVIVGYIKKITDLGDDITYILPAATCPKCGTELEESERPAQNLVFTRHQLAAIASI